MPPVQDCDAKHRKPEEEARALNIKSFYNFRHFIRCITIGFALILPMSHGGLVSQAGASERDGRPRVIVLSAASASTAVQSIANAFFSETGIDVRLSVASSGTLARQIIQGAPADIYVSASGQWIETLQTTDKLESELIRPLMRNRLVMVSPASSSLNSLLDLSQPVAVKAALGEGRIAMGDPRHVPAGAYAQEALTNLGLWPAVRDRLALQINVRAVLAMVERGETPLGIIYATDAALTQDVKIAAIVPPKAHTPIQYFAAVVAGHKRPETTDFFEFLFSPAAQAIMTRHGFGVFEADASDPPKP